VLQCGNAGALAAPVNSLGSAATGRAIIIIMMALLAILPSVIFKDGLIDEFEKRMNRLINITVFFFFLLINSLSIYFSVSYS
jgi:hypothetical protein